MAKESSQRRVYRRIVLGSSATALGSVSGCASDGSVTPSSPEPTAAEELTPIDDRPRETEFLDRVYFGDTDSEGDRVTTTDAPVIEGGLEVPAREVAAESGEIAVELACDPDDQTLLTMRLWADEPSATHAQLAVDGTSLSTRVRVPEPELPGRFYYVTVAIPEEYTENTQTVTVEVTAGSDTPDHVYALYTHTENFYAPPPEETQGSPPEAPEPSDPDFDRMRANLIAAFDEGVDWEKDIQKYGESFQDRVEAGEIPAKYHGLSKLHSRGALQQPRDFIQAYNLEDSRHYGDEELIDRALAFFDGICRYQGHRGVFEQYTWNKRWIGGPDRTGVGGGLEGFWGTYLGLSFMELQPILEERPELLEEDIDNDGDGEATVTRKEAYVQLWRDYLWKNMLLRFAISTKAFNQSHTQSAGIRFANEILKDLSPADAAPDHIIRAINHHKAGILPLDDALIDFELELQNRNEGQYGTFRAASRGDNFHSQAEDGRLYENKHWHWSDTRHYTHLSPKGITHEWGYTPGYGYELDKVSWLVDVAEDHELTDRFRDYMNGIQHMVYPTLHQNGERWGAVGAIGSRTPRQRWGHITILGWVYAALELNHPPANRIVRERLKYGDDFESLEFSPGDQNRTRGYGNWIEKLPDLRAWYHEQEPTDYRLPAERESQYVWFDEMMGVSMIHEPDATHYVNNWSGGSMSYHRISPEYRAFGDFIGQACETSLVESYTVGPYEVALNRSNTVDVRVPGGPRAHVPSTAADSALDLVSGEPVDPGVDQVIDRSTTLALDTRRSPGPPESGPQPSLTDAAVDESTRTATWRWEVPTNCRDSGVHSLPLEESPATGMVTSYYHDAATLGTNQLMNHVPYFFQPHGVDEDRMPVEVSTTEGTDLDVENIDQCDNRLLVEQPPSEETTVTCTGILPTFERYDAWSVDAPGLSSEAVSTAEALEASVDSETEIATERPVTWTLPLDGQVTRVVFTHESSWDPSGLTTILETGDGRVLWEETEPADIMSSLRAEPLLTDELVNLEGLRVEDAVHFRVVNTAVDGGGSDEFFAPMTAEVPRETATPTTVSEGWFRSIRNVRIEYADGSARYPQQ
jgi:hypothetical protein